MDHSNDISELAGPPEVEPSAEVMKAKLEAHLDKHFRQAVERGPDGAQRIAELFAIMLERPIRYDERLALRAGLRERTIDTQKLHEALRRGSAGGLTGVLEESADKNKGIYAERAEDWRISQSRAAAAQQHVVGTVNLAEAHLPAHDRSRIEAVLGDGRANPRTISTMIANQQTEEIIELAQDLEDERELQRSRARSLTRR